MKIEPPRPRQPSPEHEWISVCSAHTKYNYACAACQGGEWMMIQKKRYSLKT